MKTLETIQVGDTVIRRYSGLLGNREICKVTGVTDTLIKVGGYRFRKSNGREPGSHRGSYIWIPEEGEIEEIKSEQKSNFLRAKLASVNWQTIPLSVLKQIDSELQQHATQTTPQP